MTLLDDRLRTRFEWGLLADVTPPDFETRLAIVKNKAVALGMDLPDKIASYIAENVTANVRQLEGTVNKILAYKDLLGNEADEATVTRAMQDILKKSNEYIPTPDNILDYISKYYGIEKEIICGQQRVKDAVAARADRHVSDPQHDQSAGGGNRQGIRQPGSLHGTLFSEAGRKADEEGSLFCRDGERDQNQYQQPALKGSAYTVFIQFVYFLFPHFPFKRKTVPVEKEAGGKAIPFCYFFSTSCVEAFFLAL